MSNIVYIPGKGWCYPKASVFGGYTPIPESDEQNDPDFVRNAEES